MLALLTSDILDERDGRASLSVSINDRLWPRPLRLRSKIAVFSGHVLPYISPVGNVNSRGVRCLLRGASGHFVDGGETVTLINIALLTHTWIHTGQEQRHDRCG